MIIFLVIVVVILLLVVAGKNQQINLLLNELNILRNQIELKKQGELLDSETNKDDNGEELETKADFKKYLEILKRDLPKYMAFSEKKTIKEIEEEADALLEDYETELETSDEDDYCMKIKSAMNWLNNVKKEEYLSNKYGDRLEKFIKIIEEKEFIPNYHFDEFEKKLKVKKLGIQWMIDELTSQKILNKIEERVSDGYDSYTEHVVGWEVKDHMHKALLKELDNPDLEKIINERYQTSGENAQAIKDHLRYRLVK